VLRHRRYLLRLQFGKPTNSGEANGVLALSLGKEADAATGKARKKKSPRQHFCNQIQTLILRNDIEGSCGAS
jgi:hypothetical protein